MVRFYRRGLSEAMAVGTLVVPLQQRVALGLAPGLTIPLKPIFRQPFELGVSAGIHYTLHALRRSGGVCLETETEWYCGRGHRVGHRPLLW